MSQRTTNADEAARPAAALVQLPASADACAFAAATDTETVWRTGKVFEVGAWPQKDYAMSADDLDAAVAGFSPVPVKIEHADSVLDGKLGALTDVWRQGADLMGRVELPVWLADVLRGSAIKVSTAWDRASKRLEHLGLVTDPAIPDAALYSAFAAFAGQRHSASDAKDLQQIHDLATRQGATCPPGASDGAGASEDGDGGTTRMSMRSGAPDGHMSASASAPGGPARKRSRMNLKDWILGKAQEEGVELDAADVQAAFTQQDDEARTRVAALEAQNTALAAQVEAEKKRVEQHEAAFARAAQDKRDALAATFAAQAVSAHRIAPAAQEALAALHARCATLDSTATFSDAQTTTCALLAELVAALPDLSVFTTEHVKPDAVAALFTQATTPGDRGSTPKDMTAERRAELLGKTQLGRAITQQASASASGNGSGTS